MSKQHRHPKRHELPVVPSAARPLSGGSPVALPAEAAEVQRFIVKGNSKSAVELAKGIHKRLNNAASESLLVDAYLARIRSLREQRMEAEADALVAVVRERYACAGARLEFAARLSAGSPLDELVRPLADADLPREQRTEIEAALARRLDDLSELAQCSALPPTHPLRTGAAALEAAFREATSGPVPEERLALPEISRRGPLAAWKMLVRAIGCFYRHDNEGCERYLRAIDSGLPPARIVPALRVLSTGHPGVALLPPARALLAELDGGRQRLHAELAALDAAFTSSKKAGVVAQVRRTVQTCRETAPDLLEKLQQRISIRSLQKGLPQREVPTAMGGPSLKNAHFWLLLARTMEDPREPLALPACSLWEEFRAHAVHERWFPADGPEVATLYLHMAELLDRVPREELEDLQEEFLDEFPGYAAYYSDQPAAVRAVLAERAEPDFYFIYPDQLYERACQADPRAESFARWMQWARGQRHWKPAEQVAEAWRKALPSDARPLIFLADSAERRDALQRGIGFIEQAERLDPLNPEVRRARLRLLVSGAVRHLRQRKPRLAERELSVLEDLPQAREGNRLAVVAALRWVCCLLSGDTAGARRQLVQASQALNAEAVPLFLFASLGSACGLTSDEAALPENIPLSSQDSLACIVAQGCALADDLGIPIGIPLDWEAGILRDLSTDGRKLDVPQLRVLAEAALRRERNELAYAATAAGLSRGGATEARFLLLRGRALPPWESERRSRCFAAAAELARRSRDMALVDEAVEFHRTCGGMFNLLGNTPEESLKMSQKKLNEVLKRERAATSYPNSRRPARSPYDDVFEDDVDDDFDDEDDAMDFSSFADEFEQILDMVIKRRRLPRTRAAKKKKPQHSPGQGSLF